MIRFVALNSPSRQVFKTYPGTSLEVHTSSARGACLIPGRGTKDLTCLRCSQEKKKNLPLPSKNQIDHLLYNRLVLCLFKNLFSCYIYLARPWLTKRSCYT